jgi:hypothetical protein
MASTQDASGLSGAAAERTRRRLVFLISSIYWLLIFEGCLRKWVFPEYERILFFARDPLVLLVYAVALKDGWGPKQSLFLWLGILFAALSLPLMAVQYLIDPTRFYWVLALYGWRNYFMYLPLCFIAASCFKVADLERLMRQTLWLTIPIAILVYFQFRSAPTSPLNQGFGLDSDHRFSGLALVSGKIRPLGTFTSNQGQSPFVVATLAMLLIAWMTPPMRARMTWIGLAAVSAGPLSCLALSGSRTAVMWSGLVVGAAVAAALLTVRWRSPAALLPPAALVACALVILPVAFPEATDAFAERWREGDHVETAIYGSGGVYSRAFADLFNFRALMNSDHLQGYQVGFGGNAANLMGAQQEFLSHASFEQGIALESEWGRHIVDLGVLGVMFILYRVTFVVWLCGLCIRAVWRTGNVHPLLLFAFAGMLLFNGQITGQGAQNGFVWLFVGFTMAACNMGHQQAPGRVREQ